MALFNELQVGRFNGVLHKLLNMKDNAPAPQLAGDIVAGITLESDRPEWAYLGGTNLLIARGFVAGVAAQVSQAQLFNPANSNVLVVVDRILMYSTAAVSRFTVNRTAAIPGGSGAGSARDFRLGPPGGASTARVLGITPAGASVLSLGEMGAPANVTASWDLPLILAPGTGIAVNNQTVAADLGFTFSWSERVWELSERR